MKRIKTSKASAFIAACLAPIQQGEEPADTDAFRAQLARDARKARDAAERADNACWWRGLHHVRAAQGRRELAYSLYRIAEDDHGRGSNEASSAKQAAEDAFSALVLAIRRQIMISAPMLSALRWKEKHGLTGSLISRDPEVRQAIERDRQRHACQIDKMAKRSAGIRARKGVLS